MPTPGQLAWADLEVGMFTHFPPPGPGDALDQFTFPLFDANVLADCALSMGARYILFVAKHADGFTWFKTKTHVRRGIQLTAFRGGGGDVLAETEKACRARGLGLGVYLCPTDYPEGVRDGGLTDDPSRQEAYYREYLGKLTEVCTNYGPLVELWFDGGVNPVLLDRMRTVIDRHQPQAACFCGPVNPVRWIRNEEGVAPLPYWNRIPAEHLSRVYAGAEGPVGSPRGGLWIPAECDTMGQREWAGGPVRSLENLVGIYYSSVGRGAQLTLNFSPERDGSMSPEVVARCAELGRAIRTAVGHPLASTAGTGRELVLDLGDGREIDHAIVQEDLRHGERVLAYRVEGRAQGAWVVLGRGENLGHKRIHRCAAQVFDAVRLVVEDALDEPVIRSLAMTRNGCVPASGAPPTAPGGLTATLLPKAEVRLNWTASRSDSGLDRYEIHRDGRLLGESRTQEFRDAATTESTAYRYAVTAVDQAGRRGASAAVSVTTGVDAQAPAVAGLRQLDAQRLELLLTKAVDPATATQAGNYQPDHGVTVTSAVLAMDGRTVTLTTSPLEELRTYVLAITGLRDRAGRLIAPGTTASVTCVNDLVRWIPMDEGRGATVTDRIAGRSLNVRGTVTWQTQEGRTGLVFDGATTHVELGTMIPLEGRFTYAVWVRIPTDLGKGYPLAIVAQDRCEVLEYQFRWEIKRDGTVQFCMTDDTGDRCGLGLWPPNSAPKVQPERWCHVALTRDGGDFQLFLDGVPIHTSQAYARLGHPYNPVSALLGASHGKHAGSTAFNFRGLMRDLRIYGRVLTGDELRRIQRPQKQLHVTDASSSEGMTDSIAMT